MIEFSLLRLFGVVAGVSLVIASLAQLRRYDSERNQIGILALLGISLLLVSIFPNLVDLPADLLALEQMEGGRLTTLLLLSTILLWAVLISQRISLLVIRSELSELVRNSGDFHPQDPDPRTDSAVWVVIPAYNEAQNLEKLLPSIPESICGRKINALVVDDGSIDATKFVTRAQRASLLSLPVNSGGGNALLAGFNIALEQNAELIVTMDGDGQHSATDLEPLIEPILQNKADLVIGSRILGSEDGSSAVRRVGVAVFSKLINLLMGSRITDCSSGFRAISASKLAELRLSQRQYHTAELLIDAVKRGYRIEEVPIHIGRRIHGKSKKGRDFQYGISFLLVIIKTWLR